MSDMLSISQAAQFENGIDSQVILARKKLIAFKNEDVKSGYIALDIQYSGTRI